MSYIGQNLPTDVFGGYTTDTFAGDGSATTFTLSQAPFNEQGLIVVINNVIQQPTTNYTVSGTTLTIVGTAVASGDVIYARHTGVALPIGEANALDLQGQSDKLILDADADTTISADTDDQIDIKVAGTDVVKITAATLDVTGPGNTGGIININNTDTAGASTDNIGRINFVGNDGSSSASGTRAAIETEVTGNFGSTQLNIEVAAGGAAAAKIATFSPTGLDLADGNLTLANGHGINFAADANATNMSAELLDDYEEGTWTGVFKSSAGVMTMNSSYTTGRYVKIGRQVFITGYFAANGVNNANTSQGLLMSGLPFTVASTYQSYGTSVIGYFTALALTSGAVPAFYVRVEEDAMSFTQLGIGSVADVSAMTVANLSADGAIMITANYYTTS